MIDTNKTPEQIALEKKDRRTNLKKFCDSILQKIRVLKNNSGDRAIWELYQNARDLSENATIKITLDEFNFTFAHKGKPFDEDSLLSLVKQVSSEGKEDEDADAAGQFGTGFVTTHIFSRKFYLNGSYKTVTGKIYDIDRLEIDRTEDDINAFIRKMDDQINEIYKLLNNTESQLREWTELIYPLDKRSHEIAFNAMKKSEEMLPYVLVINPRIKEVTLVNHNKTVTFAKSNPYTENDLNVVDITIYSAESEPITKHVYYLKDGDNIIILPMTDAYTATRSDNISKLFVWFPLLGTEQWGTNFIFHSKFYPLEERNGIVLPCDNVNLKMQCQYNEDVLKSMNTLLHNYLLNHIRTINNTIELSKIGFNCISDDKKTLEFFESQQYLWTNIFRKLPLIETSQGRMSLYDGVKILDAEICTFFANEANQEKYFDSFYDYASLTAILPKRKECLRWSAIIHEWKLSDESSYEIDLERIAGKVSQTDNLEKLHKLLEIIKKCKQIKLFETNALIPNRKGILRTVFNLRNGKNIPEELYTRASAIIPLEMDKLIHEDFADIYVLNEYTRDQIRQAIHSTNDTKKSSTIRNGICFDTEYTQALRKYVSIQSTENPTNNRHYIMQSLSRLKGFNYEICYIPKIDEKELDYCYSAFIFLLESELLDIYKTSIAQPNWLKNNKSQLLDLINKIALIKNTDDAPRLLGSNGYAVIPNQSCVLCKLEKLRIREDDISDELANYYYKVINKELRNDWVDPDFSQFIPKENTDYAKNISSEIENALLEEYENSGHTVVNPLIIDIIRKIESKTEDATLWKSWFKHIDEKKADLNWHMIPEESKSTFYRIMKAAQNRSLLEDLAEFSENENILNKFKDFMREHKREEAEFKFKYEIGKHIENLVRERLEETLKDHLSIQSTIEDRQCGQDIVVNFKGKDIFFIECKAKWNFNESAHMSKLQIQKAYQEKERYALCAIDLTGFNVLDKRFPSINEIEDHIHIHLHVADELGDVVIPILNLNEDESDDRMTISTQYQSNIPQKVFVNNIRFEELLNAIIKEIRNLTI